MTTLNGVLRLWLTRILMFIVVATLMVLVMHVPGGDRMVPSGQFIEWNGKRIEMSRRVFDLGDYQNELRQFMAQLKEGHLPHYPYNYYPGSPKKDFMPVMKLSWANSLRLFAQATAIGSVLGILVGSLYALRSRLPRVLGFILSTAGLSLPDFMVVLAGQALTIWTYRVYDVRLWLVLSDPHTPKGSTLPLLALTLVPMGYLARVAASALDEIMREDYIRTARSKGLPEWRVIMGHAYRNALPHVAAALPTLLSLTLSSMVVVERLTNWPGLAQWLVTFLYRMPDGDRAGEWVYITPQIMATAGLIFLAFYMLLEALAQTVRLIYARGRGEVQS